MTTQKRLEELEDNLTPQEAVLLWMREAHAFGSFAGYGAWLTQQSEEAYPLIKMPAQVVAAIRSKHKGVRDELLREEFYRVQKDVLFLYFLHKQVNLRYEQEREALHLRVVLLLRAMRELVHQKYERDQVRLERYTGDRVQKKPGERERTMTEAYRRQVEAWPPEAKETVARILTFLEAVRLISVRYFAGADILFPEVSENLDWNLKTIANLKEQYAEDILGAPESDREFEDYLIGLISEQDRKKKSRAVELPLGSEPDVRHAGRRLAKQFVLMAKAEALEKLDEHQAAESVADQLFHFLSK